MNLYVNRDKGVNREKELTRMAYGPANSTRAAYKQRIQESNSCSVSDADVSACLQYLLESPGSRL